jgi:hypothetical protein
MFPFAAVKLMALAWYRCVPDQPSLTTPRSSYCDQFRRHIATKATQSSDESTVNPLNIHRENRRITGLYHAGKRRV